ncbi:MAG: hypothetical protein C0403_04550 [Desulfobacterium sp.]|nr:hypothetical protein [Desulfobacterium sp.]
MNKRNGLSRALKSTGIAICYAIIGLIFLSYGLSYGEAWAEAKPEAKQGFMEWGEKYCPEKPVSGGYLRVASPYYIGSMNPNHFPVMDWVTMSYMYEKLIILDGNYKPTIPWLAESWQFIDETTVLMKLRKGVLFHDGSSFSAKSLKYQMEWIMDEENYAWTRSWLEPLQAVELVDEYTVRWRFKRPWGSFLGTLASVPGFMISSQALEKDAAQKKSERITHELIPLRRKAKAEQDLVKAAQLHKEIEGLEEQQKKYQALAQDGKPLDTSPVGTGPYMLEAASTDNYLTLKRNPDWWFGKSIGKPEMPYFDGIRVSIIPDPSVRLANLKAGEIDSIVLNPIQYRQVKDDSKLTVSTFPVNFLVYMIFNHAKGPCSDIRVRKAISHAIDREALVMGTQQGLGRIASCMYPDDHWAHNPELKPVSYDPELSKKLLAEAGFANGLTLKGFVINTPEAQAFTKAQMAMLEKVGITWKPMFLSITGMIEPFKKLDFDLLGSMYPFIQEPDHIATLLYDPKSPFNNGRSSNSKAIELIKSGREITREESRRKTYFELEKTLCDNYEDVWLFWPTAVLASSKNLTGLNLEMYKSYGEGYHFSHPQWFKDGRP